MASTEFLKTEQKNEHIQFTNFEFTHKNLNTYNLGEIKVSYYEPIFPRDSAQARVNDEVICQALENPAFSHFKLCHKSVYMPNCNLWKYFNNFITNKPDFTWTNSNIQKFIDDNQPYTPPYFTYRDILPIIAFARGFHGKLYYGFSIRQDSSTSKKIRLISDPSITFADVLNSRHDEVGTQFHLLCPYANMQNTQKDLTGFYDWNDQLQNNIVLDYLLGTLPAVLRTKFEYSDGTSISVTESQEICRNLIPFICFDIANSVQSVTSLESRPVSTAFTNSDQIYFKFDQFTNGISSNIPGDSLLYDENGTLLKDVFCLPLPAAYESAQYRMTPLAYLWYLCNNACKLMDSLGLPVYTEYINTKLFTKKFDALPFFAYSRFYHETIADKQLQVNTVDWSESNGPLCPEFSTSDAPQDHYNYGWILHHPEIPYNTAGFQYDEKLIIRNVNMGRCLLLGINMNLLLFNSSLNPTTQPFLDRSNKSLSHTYMIYNGLLHLQFANFPPDYFTEVLLDPLAGAQDINIPNTITQLQEKSKLQDFLNQTSWTRNIKEWLQSQWDSFSKYTTVNEPSICGSCDVDINIGQVLQTSESANTPLGTRAGVGSGYGNGNLVDQQFGEYGVLLICSYIVVDSYYINRLDQRNTLKATRFDYPIPQFANLGNEAVDVSELSVNVIPSLQYSANNLFFSYAQSCPLVPGYQASVIGQNDVMIGATMGNDVIEITKSEPQVTVSQNNDTFGYIPRYSIYKHHMDEVHGDFLTTLKRWVPTRELNFNPRPSYCFISYELASQTSNLLKNFVQSDTFKSDNFLVNQTNVVNIRRALPYIVKPNL